jgi:hypothetical protein
MTCFIFLVAVLLLAIGLRHYEPKKKGGGGAESAAFSLVGPSAHLGGTMAIGWMGDMVLAALAFLAIPLLAYAVHSLVILPILRSKRLRGAYVDRRTAGPQDRRTAGLQDRSIVFTRGVRSRQATLRQQRLDRVQDVGE